MLRLLIDQDFDHDILRGLLRRIPELDFVTAYEEGLIETEDPELLRWAAKNERLLATHDRSTMPVHASSLLEQGEQVAGIVIVPRQLAMAKSIEDLELIVVCSNQEDWLNSIEYLPL
ncbi:MAG: DUF5615 family PIN-like protein [Acidobacteria bacterium]|nr:DUF5615 family PIN-like protein [Acidobacteriota bacterium]